MNDTATGALRAEEVPLRRLHPRRGGAARGGCGRIGKRGKLPLAHLLVLGYYYKSLLMKRNGLRAWRNWQTRTVQVRMGATPWRFKSSRPHHLKLGASAVAEVFSFACAIGAARTTPKRPRRSSYADLAAFRQAQSPARITQAYSDRRSAPPHNRYAFRLDRAAHPPPSRETMESGNTAREERV